MNKLQISDRGQSILKDLVVVCCLFLLAIALFGRILPTENYLIYNGDITYFYAHETVVDNIFSQGEFSLWNPYFGGGSPSLSKIQIGLLYPPMSILRLVFPIVTRLNWDAVAHVFLAGLGVYLLVRDLATRRSAAAFSAVAFMLSGSIIPRVYAGHASVLHAIAWTGWLLFAYRRMLYRRSWWYVLLSIIISAFVALGGHPQMSAIVFLVPISYFLFVYVVETIRSQNWPELRRGSGLSALVALGAIGLTAVQLIPYLEWLTHTARGIGKAFDSFERMIYHSIQLQHLITPILPLTWFDMASSTSINLGLKTHFWEVSPFVGLLTLFLIAVGLFMVKDRNRHLTRYFIGLAVFGLLLSMGTYNPVYPIILDRFPYIRAPGRFLLLWTFSLAVLGGYYLDGLLTIISDVHKRHSLRKPLYAAATITLVAFILTVGWITSGKIILAQLQSQGYMDDIDPDKLLTLFQRSMIVVLVTLALICGLFWAARNTSIKALHWGWFAVAVLTVEMFLFARPLVRPYAVNQLFVSQDPLAMLDIDPGEVRVDGYRTPPNYLVPTLSHVRNGEEHAALRSLLGAGEIGQQLFSATYVPLTQPSNDPELELVQRNDSAYLYRQSGSLPRIYAAGSIEIVGSVDEALAHVLSDRFSPYDKAVVTVSAKDDLQSLRELETPAETASQSAFYGEYASYGSDEVTAYVTTDQPAMVIFSELYYPGWKSTVDGVPSTIWKTNYAFRGVVVEQGEHVIEMQFVPLSFRLGVTISFLTILTIITVSLCIITRQALRKRQ
ncbi:MAG: YfhO family protein [Candidatus Promineifilaceae bacterium]